MSAVDALLSPNSVALVGISERNPFGSVMYENLVRNHYPGEIHFVNPRRKELFGRPCLGSVSELPEVPDVAVIGLGAERAVNVLDECAAVGVRGAIISTDGFRESGSEGVERQRRLLEIASATGMAVCGPNSMGLVNSRQRIPLWLGAIREFDSSGPIGAVVQSGSVGIALLNAERSVQLSHLVSSGNEAVTPAARYLEALVERDDVEILASHLEAVNDAERYLAVLERAHALGKPVVVLKAGASPLAKQVIAGHTGSLGGSDRVTRSVLSDRGAIVVETLEELIETLVLLRSGRRPRGIRMGVVTISGGFSGLSADRAQAVGLELPSRIEGSKGSVANLIDAWGNGDLATTASEVLGTAATATNIDVLAVVHDSEAEPRTGSSNTSRTLARTFAGEFTTSELPAVWITPTPRPADPETVRQLAALGIPVLQGLSAGLAACARVGAWTQKTSLSPRPSLTRPESDGTGGEIWSEAEGKEWLASAGVAVPELAEAGSAGEALEAAHRIGYPVVLKKAVPGLEHKAARGYVRLDIIDDDMLIRHYHELMDDGVGTVLIERQMPRGIEVMISAFLDQSFGAVALAGFGGTTNELLPPPAILVAPVTEASALSLVERSGIAATIRKLCGRNAESTIARLTIAVRRISDSLVGSCALTPLRLIEVNPIVIPFDGGELVAVDAVVQPLD